MRSRTTCAFLLSRLPVGSSGRTMDGPLGQTPRDRDALAFAAGKLGGEMIEAMFKADQLQQFDRALSPVGGRPVGFEHRDLNVLGRGKGRQKMKGLEDEADLASAVGGGIGMIRNRLPAIEQRAGSGPIERAEQLEQRRFSATARARDRDELALANGKIDAAQGLDLTVVEFPIEILGLEQRRSADRCRSHRFTIRPDQETGRASERTL